MVLLILGPLSYWVWKGNLESRYIADPLLGMILRWPPRSQRPCALYLHPVYRQDYLAWLATTPWRRGLRLPVGTIRPSLGEILCYFLLLAIAILLRPYSSLTTSQVFAGALLPLMAMAVFWTLANALTGERGLAAAALAIPPLAATLVHTPRVACLLLLAFPILAYTGVYRSLARYPWEKSTSPRSARVGTFNTTRDPKSNRLEEKLSLGWPHTALKLEPAEWVQSPLVAAIEAALAGGWVFALAYCFTQLKPPEGSWTLVALLMVIGAPTGFVAVVRLVAYGRVLCERLCFGWRLGLGRWLVAKHDSILLVPIAAVGIALLIGLSLHYQVGLMPPIAIGIGVAVGIFILRAVGPRVTVLYYTGVHNRSPRDNNPSYLTTRAQR